MSHGRPNVDINQSLEDISTSDRPDIEKSYGILMLFFQNKLPGTAPSQYKELYFEFSSTDEGLNLVEKYLGHFKEQGLSIGSAFTLKNEKTNKCHIGITINSDIISLMIQYAEQQKIAKARANRYYELLFNRSTKRTEPSTRTTASFKV